jgi:hypothetical protein
MKKKQTNTLDKIVLINSMIEAVTFRNLPSHTTVERTLIWY